MKSRRVVALASFVTFWGLLGSGCSVTSLRESNRRLKESNDRLISENNRLEEELVALQKRPGSSGLSAVESGVVTSLDPDAGIEPSAAVSRPASGSKKAAILDSLDDDVEVFETRQGTKLRIADRVFFSMGQANLSPRGRQILDKVARVINGHQGQLVRVDGHTDDTPIRKVRNLYPTNWELSSARACAVVRYLVEKGNVNARRIFPAGFSYYRPVSAGRSGNSKSQNRRVEITILNENA